MHQQLGDPRTARASPRWSEGTQLRRRRYGRLLSPAWLLLIPEQGPCVTQAAEESSDPCVFFNVTRGTTGDEASTDGLDVHVLEDTVFQNAIVCLFVSGYGAALEEV